MLKHYSQRTRAVLYGTGGLGMSMAYSSLFRRGLREQRKSVCTEVWFQRWIQKFSTNLNVELRLSGHPLQTSGLFVANHISWLDMLVLMQLKPFAFIAKSEVAGWPAIGDLARSLNTIFIDRESPFSVYRALPSIEQALQTGKPVLFFPEGTTTRGQEVLPFFPMLFETAVRTKLPVQSIAVRYLDRDNKPLTSVSFVDDEMFHQSLFRTMKERHIVTHIHISEPLDPTIYCRKQLAKRSRAQIQQILVPTD